MILDAINSPNLESTKYNFSFIAGFNFSYAIVLPEHKLVASFIDGWCGDLEFVGKLYDFYGVEVATIPFPPLGIGNRQNAFWYASESEEGVWVGFHQQGARDFGGVFSIKNNSFVSFNEAR